MSEIVTALEQFNNVSLIAAMSIAACIISFFVLLRGSKKNRALEKKLLKLERDLRIANNSAVAMGQELIEIEKRIYTKPSNTVGATESPVINANNSTPHSIQNPLSQTTANPVSQTNVTSKEEADEESVYDYARQLLAQGLSIKDITKRSGLSFAEVSLLHSLSESSTTSH